jgi:signal transduction histidine kinase
METFFTTKPAGKGTGLGLSTVHKLATQAHGALRLISEAGVPRSNFGFRARLNR